MDTIELSRIRRLLPDLTMYYDRQAILESLHLLSLDVVGYDSDEQITIWLENDYYITWRPLATTADGHLGWAHLVPGSWALYDELYRDVSEIPDHMHGSGIEEQLALCSMKPIPMYRVWATLSHADPEMHPVVTPRVVRDCDPATLLRECFTWFQKETKLPLRLRHTQFTLFDQGERE